MFLNSALKKSLPAGRNREASKRYRLVPIRQNFMCHASQMLDSLYIYIPLGAKLNDRSHILKHFYHADDFGLKRGVFDNCPALREYRRENRIFCGANTWKRKLYHTPPQTILRCRQKARWIDFYVGTMRVDNADMNI